MSLFEGIKNIFLSPTYRKPWVLFVFFVLFDKALGDLNFWVGMYLRQANSPSYEAVVFNYSSPLNLLKDFFRYREEFFDFNYVARNYWRIFALGIALFLLIKFVGKIKFLLAEGKPRKNFEFVTDWLDRPSKSLFFIFLAIYTLMTFRFIDEMRRDFTLGANQVISKDFEALTSRKNEFVLSKFNNRSSFKNSECVVIPALPEYSTYAPSLAEFIFLILTGEYSPAKLRNTIQTIPKNISIEIDESVVKSRQPKIEKSQYTKEEVEQILRQEREGASELDIPRRPQREDSFLLVKTVKGEDRLLFASGQSASPIHIGNVRPRCSKIKKNLQEQSERPSWELSEKFEQMINMHLQEDI